MSDIKRKIKQLLALSSSDNEHEAMAAVVKANELMLKYKVSEEDIRDSESKNKKVVHVETIGSWSNRFMKPTGSLAAVIAEHFMCGSISSRPHGKQLMKVVFIGFEDDARMAALTFDYAWNFINNKLKEMKKDWSNLTNKKANMYADSYMLGWVCGLEEKLKEQYKEIVEETGLAIVMPAEVSEYMEKYKKVQPEKPKVKPEMYMAGFKDGKNFDLAKNLDSDNNKLEMS